MSLIGVWYFCLRRNSLVYETIDGEMRFYVCVCLFLTLHLPWLLCVIKDISLYSRTPYIVIKTKTNWEHFS